MAEPTKATNKQAADKQAADDAGSVLRQPGLLGKALVFDMDLYRWRAATADDCCQGVAPATTKAGGGQASAARQEDAVSPTRSPEGRSLSPWSVRSETDFMLGFGWADGVFLHGSIDSQVMVEGLDAAYEDSPGCASAASSWPISASTFAAGGWYSDNTNFNAGRWLLYSAKDTVDVMVATNQNIYIAGTKEPSGDPNMCSWVSLAALHDYIEAQGDGLDQPLYTGISLGIGDPPTVVPSDYKNMLELGLLEAAEHPDILKVVWWDEPYRVLQGPETKWFENDHPHWSPLDVRQLQALVHGRPWMWGRKSLQLGELELWPRMIDPAVMRFIVPSAVLGVPAGDWSEFDEDHAVEVIYPINWYFQRTWPRSVQSVWLEFIYATGAESNATDQDLILEVQVGGATVGELDLLAAGHNNRVVRYASYRIDSASGGPWPSNASWGISFVGLRLRPGGETNTQVDRTVWIAGVRVIYRDESTGRVLWSSGYCDPDRARYNIVGGVIFKVNSEPLATSNAEWRITDSIDGVTLTADTPYQSEAHGYTTGAFERLVECTSDHLHNHYFQPKRCLIEERSQDFYADYIALLDTAKTRARMDIAAKWADGVLGLYLPTWLELLKSGDTPGRFSKRPVLVAGWNVMVYEPMLMRTTMGEVHEWSVGVPCDGAYTIEWKIESGHCTPNLQWWIHFASSGEDQDIGPGWVRDAWTDAPTPTGGCGDVRKDSLLSGTKVVDLKEGDKIFVEWAAKWPNDRPGGGEGPGARSYMLVKVTPPDDCTTELEWAFNPRHDTNDDAGDPAYLAVQEMYDCVTRWFVDPSRAPC